MRKSSLQADDAKIALLLDELSDKVTGYRERPLYPHDAVVSAERADLLHAAAAQNADVYYRNGELIQTKRSADEYWNRLSALDRELAELQSETKRLLTDLLCTKSPSSSASLKNIRKRQRQKSRLRNRLTARRAAEIKANRIRIMQETDFLYDCAICLIIRDENEYLEEWLIWHIGQGVEHFYIYDHGSKEPVAGFLKGLGGDIQSKVTVIDFGGPHNFAQQEAYNDCLNRYRYESRWIGFIDSDEMVRVKNGKTLPEFLKGYGEYAGLFAAWIIYGADGQADKSALPCRERFTRVSPSLCSQGVGKVFVQPLFMKHMLTHNGYPVEGFTVVDEFQKPVEFTGAWKADATMELVCIDHYYTKSYREWVEKISRGSCDPVYSRKYEEFFTYNPDMQHYRETVFPVQEYEISKKYN